MEDFESNMCCEQYGETTDPAVAESEGSEKEKVSLDFLSDLTNSAPPIVDVSNVNGFDVEAHKGLEFIKKDNRGVPAKTKVIDVNKETEKSLLEYVHGGLEWVDSNII